MVRDAGLGADDDLDQLHQAWSLLVLLILSRAKFMKTRIIAAIALIAVPLAVVSEACHLTESLPRSGKVCWSGRRLGVRWKT